MGLSNIIYIFQNGVSKSWDIHWQIELGYEVFPKLNRTTASMGKLFLLISCLSFLLVAWLRAKARYWELEDPGNLHVLCKKWDSGGWNFCLDFLVASEDSNSSQESFEDKLDCTWNRLQEYTMLGPELLSKYYLYYLIKFQHIGSSASLWFPGLLMCWWFTIISSHQWDCYGNSWDVLNSQWPSLAQNKCAVTSSMVASLKILALSFSPSLQQHAQYIHVY